MRDFHRRYPNQPVYSPHVPLVLAMACLAGAIYFGISYWGVEKHLRLRFIQERNFALLCTLGCALFMGLWLKGMKTSNRSNIAYRAALELQRKGINSTPIRYTEACDGGKDLVEADFEGQRIVYRRRGTVNELVVGRHIYAELTGLVKTKHSLWAVVNGHIIEAGMSGEGDLFIKVDEELLASEILLWK